nr:MAG TPA: hypothetical protein [Caudoviricetes sp.]
MQGKKILRDIMLWYRLYISNCNGCRLFCLLA